MTVAACASEGAPPLTSEAALAPPPRPSDCLPVAAETDLQATVDAADSGTALCLESGSYYGPLIITKSVEIWGPRDAVIH